MQISDMKTNNVIYSFECNFFIDAVHHKITTQSFDPDIAILYFQERLKKDYPYVDSFTIWAIDDKDGRQMAEKMIDVHFSSADEITQMNEYLLQTGKNQVEKSQMTTERAKMLINNLLSEICDKTDIPASQYKSWLTQEVGMTQEEISELSDDGLLPCPDKDAMQIELQ